MLVEEGGGRGRGTAREGSRWGMGRVRSGRRRERVAGPGTGGMLGFMERETKTL